MDKLTAETITDEDVQKLKAQAKGRDNDLYDLCVLAGHPGQGTPTEPLPSDVAYKARAKLAAILNASRSAKG